MPFHQVGEWFPAVRRSRMSSRPGTARATSWLAERAARLLVSSMMMMESLASRGSAGGTPWRVDKKTAEVEIVEGYLAGRGVGVEGAAERLGDAVELREIVACK